MPPWRSTWETREDNMLGGYQESNLARSPALYPTPPLPRWLWKFLHSSQCPGGTLEKLTPDLSERLLEDV